MKKLIKFIIFAIIILIFAFFLVKKIKEKKIQNFKVSSPEHPVYTVKGKKVKKGEIKIKKSYLGIIKPDKSVNVSSKFSGFIEKIFVKENDHVKKGELLVKIDAKDIKLQVSNLNAIKSSLHAQKIALKAQLEGEIARLNYLKNRYLRYKSLFKEKAISKENFELAEANYLAQKAQVEALKSSIVSLNKKIASTEAQINLQKDRLKYLNIYSGINGVVTKIFMYEGNLAVPGKPILNIETEENYKIIVDIPVTKAEKVKKGDIVEIDFPNKIIESKINKIYPSSLKNSLLSIEIRIKKLPPNIPTNSFVNVHIIENTLTGYIVPINSILNLTNGKYLVTEKNGKFVKIPIKVIGSNEKFAVVEGDIFNGMPIAVGSESKLRLLITGKRGKIIYE